MILTATINEVKRRILFDNPQAVVAVKGDYEVNGIAFAFPAIYEDDFDLSTAVKTVYYKATDGIIYDHVVTATDTDTGYPLWVFKDEINKGAYGDVEFALVCDKVEGGNIVKRWVSMITAFRVQKSIEIDESEQEENEQTYSERLAYLMTQMASMQATVSGLASGAPTPESLVANMQEGRIYVYTGTETGYTAGHVYYYVGGVLTDGGVYGGTAVDATLTQSGEAADAAVAGAEISAIKEDLSAIRTATSEDVGKALKAKTVTNGKVTEWEFGEAGGADPEAIEQAVTDWLDEHPEATTTVADGSITETKLATALVPTLKNDYVTPEMFGAVGDGVTDDAAAINAMFASNNTIFSFGNKTYLVDNSVTCAKTCVIYFDNTTILAKRNTGLRAFEYVVGFTALGIQTHGKLTVRANSAVNIGIWLANIAGSRFDRLHVANARIWGVYMDKTTDSNGGFTVNVLSAAQCGCKAHGKAKRVDGTHLEITDITGFYANHPVDVWHGLFDNSYLQSTLVIDDSLYDNSTFSLARVVFYNRDSANPFTFDETENSKATFYVSSPGGSVPTNYTTDDVARDVFIPIGGGVSLESQHSEGGYIIDKLDTMSNPLSSRIMMGYGGRIGSYISQYDTVIMHNGSLVTLIGYTYFEAVGNGYANTWGDSRDRIYLFAQTTNVRVYMENPFVGASRLPVENGNVILNYYQFSYTSDSVGEYFACPNFSASRNIGKNILGTGNSGIAVGNTDEYAPRSITCDYNGIAANQYVTLHLRDLNIENRSDSFSPVTFYVRRRSSDSRYDAFVLKLSTTLTNAGYGIHGAVDGALTIHPSEYNNYVKVTVMLFRYDKTFFVTAEPLTFVDNTQT